MTSPGTTDPGLAAETARFAGLDLRVSPHLAGGKHAVQDGRRLYLSPAMHDLLVHAEGEGLMRLLMAIRVVRVLPGSPGLSP